MLYFSTDIRMHKVAEIGQEQKVEAAFWLPEKAIQFRISGHAAVVPNDSDEKDPSSVLKELSKGSGAEGADWWAEKREELWVKQSGKLRASFARPQPGKPLDQIDTKPADWPQDLEKDAISVSCLVLPI